MKRPILLFILAAVASANLIAQNDAEGSKDPALFTRMTGYHIYRYDDLQFDKYEFRVSSGKTQTVEGHHLFIIYYPNDNLSPVPSPLQIGRNYMNALKKIGGQTVYEYQDPGEDVVLKIAKDGKETWAYVCATGSGDYSIHLVEKESMSQDVVADAGSMARNIKQTGKVAVYGIYFDSGKSVLKPESQPALEQISKMLSENPALKLYVVCHTDNTGDYASNMKLSAERATAVSNELKSKYSVAADRLSASGVGPLSPVASNESEEGKAMNRRVELVKQ